MALAGIYFEKHVSFSIYNDIILQIETIGILNYVFRLCIIRPNREGNGGTWINIFKIIMLYCYLFVLR